MGEILFLAHRIPFPPDRGDKIRSHYLLRRLSQIAPVHVATFADNEADLTQEPKLAAIAKSYRLVHRSKTLALAGVQALASSAPVSVTAFHHQALDQYVERTLSTRPIAAIYVFSGQMGQYVPRSFSGRVVADFVDVDSAKFEAYAASREGLRGWIDAREARMLQQEEIRLARRANVSLLISKEEAELFRSRLPEPMRPKTAVRWLGNGVDSTFFDPAEVRAEQRMLAGSGPRLIFTGQMDYAPNVAAAERVMDRILPLVRNSAPDASFHVVGRNPPHRLVARDGRDGIFVWGAVPDVRTWLKAADLAVVPLEIGRGVQNKVLEAMSMEVPVVLSAEAATGIDAVDGRDFLIAQSDAELAQSIVDLIGDSARAGRLAGAGREYILENMSWQAALSPLPEIIGLGRRSRRDAA